MNTNIKEPPKTTQVLLVLASFVIIIAGMKAAESIVIPFLLAAFISIVVSPPYFWLKSKNVPGALAIIIVIFTFLIFIGGIGVVVGTSVNDFTTKLPLYEAKINSQAHELMDWLYSTGIIKEKIKIDEIFKPSSIFKLIGDILNQISSLLSNGFLILLTVVFMLLDVSGLPVKFKKFSKSPDQSIARFQSITENINKYIGLKTILNLCNAILATIFLSIMGVDYFFLWGLLAFLLNYIPTIGSFFALVPPALLALIQFGFIEAIIVVIGFVVINTLIGNIIEPRFMGKGLGLSTLVVFLSLLFWGWVLGPIGMLLSVPLTITIKIILDSSDETRWLAVLLGPE